MSELNATASVNSATVHSANFQEDPAAIIRNRIHEALRIRDKGSNLHAADSQLYIARTSAVEHGLDELLVELHCLLAMNDYYRYFQSGNNKFLRGMFSLANLALDMTRRTCTTGSAKATAHNCMGHYYRAKGDFRTARYHYFRSKEVFGRLLDLNVDAALGLCVVYHWEPFKGQYYNGLEMIDSALKMATDRAGTKNSEIWQPILCEILLLQAEANAKASLKEKKADHEELAVFALAEAWVYAEALMKDSGKPHCTNQFNVACARVAKLLDLSAEQLAAKLKPKG
jgi:hypothetical protein